MDYIPYRLFNHVQELAFSPIRLRLLGMTELFIERIETIGIMSPYFEKRSNDLKPLGTVKTQN